MEKVLEMIYYKKLIKYLVILGLLKTDIGCILHPKANSDTIELLVSISILYIHVIRIEVLVYEIKIEQLIDDIASKLIVAKAIGQMIIRL